jgi:hypothetical protein
MPSREGDVEGLEALNLVIAGALDAAGRAGHPVTVTMIGCG